MGGQVSAQEGQRGRRQVESQSGPGQAEAAMPLEAATEGGA